MAITTYFEHTVEPEFEQYAFRSTLNPKQCHFIDRDGDGPWKLSLVNVGDLLSRDDALTYVRETQELIEFMDKLDRRDLRRTTEPGQPPFEEGL